MMMNGFRESPAKNIRKDDEPSPKKLRIDDYYSPTGSEKHRRTTSAQAALFTDDEPSPKKLPTGSVDQRKKASRQANRHLEALNRLDFKKQFLILAYCGKNKLQDVTSVDAIKSMENRQMSDLEPELWRLFGRNCIQEKDRVKDVDWDSDKPFAYHCHVDSDGKYMFKGPYLQPGQTHLQRVIGDENVLVVKFSGKTVEETGKNSIVRCSNATSTYQPNRSEGVGICNSSSVYHGIREDGILVGLRRYTFFVFKDGGKEEKNKEKQSPTSSSVKCYFVCTDCMDSIDPSSYNKNAPSVLFGKSVAEARSLFMHIHNVSSMAKYNARFSLILSKTVELDIDFASVNVEEIEDIPCLDQDGCIVRNKEGEPLIHTDGTGFISQDLALKCPRNIIKGKCSSQGDYEKILLHQSAVEKSSGLEKSITSYVGDPPLLIQFRLFYNGTVVKGTLLVNKKLPRNTIQIRPSMIKVRSDPKHVNDDPVTNSFGVVTTSMKPKRTNLSKYLIALLSYGGVPDEYFLQLLTDSLEDTKKFHCDKRAALRASIRHGDMDDFLLTKMILCGIPLNESFLKARLSVLMRTELNSLREGKLPMDDSYYLMGTADPTGILKPDQVCVILESGQVSGDILVYKHPGLHFGDIHVLTATYVKELESYVGNAKYGIFFPIVGPRSISDEIANSDLDGDMYWVCRNTQLLNHFRPSKPWTQTHFTESVSHDSSHYKPTDYSENGLERTLFEQFLTARFSSNSVGVAAISWLSLMDTRLTLDRSDADKIKEVEAKLLELTDKYYDALDVGKSGKKVDIPPRLRQHKNPHFMEKKKSVSNNSPQSWRKDNSYHSTSVLGLIYDEVESYEKNEIQQVIEVDKLPSFEQDVPEEYIVFWKEQHNLYRADMSRALSSEAVKDEAAAAVYRKYKQILYHAPELHQSRRKAEDIYMNALAIYHVSYDYAKYHGVRSCYFAWKVAGEALCEYYQSRQDDNIFMCSKSVLRELQGC